MGFIYSDRRENYKGLDWSITIYIDPMTIDFRLLSGDLFPKSGLDKSYIGDKYPLCTNLPQHSFLRISAIYRVYQIGTISFKLQPMALKH